MIKRKIKEKLRKALEEVFTKDEEIAFEVEKPRSKNFGDYCTNLALVLQGKLNRPAKELSKKLIEFLKADPLFLKIEIAGPGFINFWINPSFSFRKLKINT